MRVIFAASEKDLYKRIAMAAYGEISNNLPIPETHSYGIPAKCSYELKTGSFVCVLDEHFQYL